MASGVTLKMRAIKALPPEVVSRGNQAHYHAQAGQVRVHAMTPDPALFRDRHRVAVRQMRARARPGSRTRRRVGGRRHRVAVRQMRAARELEVQKARVWAKVPWSDSAPIEPGDREILITAVRRGAVAPDGLAQRRAIAEIDEPNGNALRLENIHQDIDRRAVQRLGRHYAPIPIGQAEVYRGLQRRHSGSRG